MASTAVPFSDEAARSKTNEAAGIPWFLWALVVAVCLVTLGGQVDVSWHRSIGRDTFWTPPHMMVYACGVIAGISCGWLILATTFGWRSELQANAVGLFGLKAPLGAFVTAWGGLMMLYSAPVDNWWHNAYGLDVQVVSPPHVLLLSGTAAVGLGTLLLAAAHMNRARAMDGAAANPAYARVFLFVGALAVIHLMSYSMGYTFDTRLHQWKPYLVMSAGVPFALAALAVATGRRWTATWVAAIYTVFMLALVWGLPLIPASPRIGPVYQNVTQMIPPKFPILILAPALAMDLLWVRFSGWVRTVVSGLAWVAVLVGVEWPFASFLMTKSAANWFFGTRYVDFGTGAGNPDVLRVFEAPQSGAHLLAGLGVAVVVACGGVRLGEFFGRWMRGVYR
jgi:hypothetical protein